MDQQRDPPCSLLPQGRVIRKGASSDVDLDATIGNEVPWASIGVGATYATSTSPYPFGQIWAVSTTGVIYSLLGYLEQDGTLQSAGWLQIPGAATSIALMNETNASSSCSATWHIPWVTTSANEIFRFVPYGTECLDGYWQQLPGAALAITGDDIVLGTDSKIYQWSEASNAFRQTVQPSLPAGVTIETVGAQTGNNTITVTDSSHDLWQETCGWFGC